MVENFCLICERAASSCGQFELGEDFRAIVEGQVIWMFEDGFSVEYICLEFLNIAGGLRDT